MAAINLDDLSHTQTWVVLGALVAPQVDKATNTIPITRLTDEQLQTLEMALVQAMPTAEMDAAAEGVWATARAELKRRGLEPVR